MTDSLRHMFRTVLVVARDRQTGDGLHEELAGLGCFTAGPFVSVDEALIWLESDCADVALVDALAAGPRAGGLATALRSEGIPLVYFDDFNSERGLIRAEHPEQGLARQAPLCDVLDLVAA